VSARVLLVDDEPAILDAIEYALRGEGYDVDTRRDGESALAAARTHPYDVVVLDVLLPGVSGTEVCRRLRKLSDVPIVMLTARDAEVDRVVGLDAGADDYVTKPFSTPELISRIRAILRRRDLDRQGTTLGIRQLGGLTIDVVRHEVTVDGAPVHLTPTEFRLLALLAGEPERVFTRQQILEHLWRTEQVVSSRASDVHVASLRAKIEGDPANPTRLVTVRGTGYKLLAV
jgi:two-component system response regulator RegX3